MFWFCGYNRREAIYVKCRPYPFAKSSLIFSIFESFLSITLFKRVAILFRLALASKMSKALVLKPSLKALVGAKKYVTL